MNIQMTCSCGAELRIDEDRGVDKQQDSFYVELIGAWEKRHAECIRMHFAAKQEE